MGLFGRGRVSRRIIGRYKPVAQAEVPVEHLVEESRMVAHSATRMAVKNRLIMDAAGRRQDFDLPGLRAEASETLERLAQQQRAAADYEKGRGGDPRRAPVLLGLAEALERDATDRALLEEIVDAAREAAWAEVAMSIEKWINFRSERTSWYHDPAYLETRADRMEILKGLDLRELQLRAEERGDEPPVG